MDFFKNTVSLNPLKAEYRLTTHIGGLLREESVTVKVLKTKDKRFSATYKEDKGVVDDKLVVQSDY